MTLTMQVTAAKLEFDSSQVVGGYHVGIGHHDREWTRQHDREWIGLHDGESTGHHDVEWAGHHGGVYM